jgi:hypothetical protein
MGTGGSFPRVLEHSKDVTEFLAIFKLNILILLVVMNSLAGSEIRGVNQIVLKR